MLYVALFKDSNCVVTDAVRISSLIVITRVYCCYLHEILVELILLMALHKSVVFFIMDFSKIVFITLMFLYLNVINISL